MAGGEALWAMLKQKDEEGKQGQRALHEEPEAEKSTFVTVGVPFTCTHNRFPPLCEHADPQHAI